MNQLKKNFIYNVAYQILILLLPIITVPYVSRVLGTDGIGVYSYTYSVVYYFMLIALLGINNYGNRTIAKCRDDKEKLSKSFFSIYIIQVLMSLIMIAIYIIYILLFEVNYKFIASIQILYLISNMFDINWFFFGLEKFKLTVSRSTIIKVISLIFIFIFVNDKSDLWIYTLILSLSTLLSQLILIPFLYKEVKFVKIALNDIKRNIKPCLILFIPVIAVSLYKVMDKIMLGNMSDISEVGLYEQAEKITQIPLGIITALGTVMMPRISNLVHKGQSNEIKMYLKKSMEFTSFLTLPIVFGLISIADDFIPIFLGIEFAKSVPILKLLSITLIFISYANVLRTQFLIPNNMDKEYTISVILGAIVNIIINLLLIPKYNSIGACIGTIFAEATVYIYQCYILRRKLPIFEYIKDSTCFFIESIIMFSIILLINFMNINICLKIIIKILIGIALYAALNYKYICKFLKIKGKKTE